MTTKTPQSTRARKAETRAAVQADNPLDNLPNNLDVPEEFRAEIVQAVAQDEQRTHISENGRAPKVEAEDRVWIILDDNDEIPPGGQFVGVNGVGYKLMSGIEMHVPRAVLHVLDLAVKGVPVQDPVSKRVVGYKDRKRFPYTIIQNHPAA